MDPVYGFSAVNVEAQRRNPGSFLHWLRGMLVERRSLQVLGVGEMEVLACPNPSVLAYVRSGKVADAPARDIEDRPPPPSQGTPSGAPSPPSGASAPPEDRSASEGRMASTAPPADEDADDVVWRSQAVLCVHNLSRFAQPAELQLARWAGCIPMEVLGHVPFPTIGEEPYTVTLGPHGYLWFNLVEQGPEPGEAHP
jgi:maltose alpha-D-glucosyltransferase/alpha-amylase